MTSADRTRKWPWTDTAVAVGIILPVLYLIYYSVESSVLVRADAAQAAQFGVLSDRAFTFLNILLGSGIVGKIANRFTTNPEVIRAEREAASS